MTSATSYPTAPDLSPEDYIVIGLATCFLKEDGEIHEVKIVEPVPSAALETLIKGIPTSYDRAFATTLGTVLEGNMARIPAEFPPEAQICDDFASRLFAAARTYKARSQAKAHIREGETLTDLNFSLERKRVLNSEHIVKAEDNVKQHAYTHQVL